MKPLLNLKSKRSFHITGRGDVKIINLKENRLPLIKPDFTDLLFNKQIIIDDSQYLVTGIESYGIPLSCNHSEIGVLVKSIKMEKENKYYTPEPSELYIGYEFEVLDDPTPDWMASELTAYHDLAAVNTWLENKELRTKYLDREDIESLGGEFGTVLIEGYNEKDDFVNGFTLPHPGNSEELPKWYVMYGLGDNKWKIEYRFYTNQVSQTWKTLFEGTIKSKNELIKIMQFIGI